VGFFFFFSIDHALRLTPALFHSGLIELFPPPSEDYPFHLSPFFFKLLSPDELLGFVPPFSPPTLPSKDFIVVAS